jgi:hypothetical protein
LEAFYSSSGFAVLGLLELFEVVIVKNRYVLRKGHAVAARVETLDSFCI